MVGDIKLSIIHLLSPSHAKIACEFIVNVSVYSVYETLLKYSEKVCKLLFIAYKYTMDTIACSEMEIRISSSTY